MVGWAAQSPSIAQEATTNFAVSILVVDDLTPKPVPLTDFRISGPTAGATPRIVRTDEKGSIALSLPPGQYVLESMQPLRFRDRLLRWKHSFVVDAGKPIQLKLTDADAEQVQSTPARQVSDEAKIYQALRRGVVTVECDFGHGTGFIVDRSGLVVTNEHVTEKTRWVSLRFEKGVRVQARVLEQDRDSDVSILQFNPQAVKEWVTVPLADPKRGPLAIEGERVLAIGSPLHQEKVLTTGIVSKVEDGVLISDTNINPGNSGGPLINLAGEAIGITTFGDITNRGPGIGGTVSIQKVIPVLERAKQKLADQPPVPEQVLPDVSSIPIPSEALAEAATKKLERYELKEPKNFLTIVNTPFIQASISAAYERELQKTKNKRSRNRGGKGVKEQETITPGRFWERYTLNAYDAVVPITVVPVLKETSGSRIGSIFGALGGVRTTATMEYRDDFYDMRLFRGDTPVEPVRRNRQSVEVLYQDYFVQAKDQAYGGIYFYDPSVFEPSQPLTLKVLRESNTEKWTEVKIDKKLQQKIWDAFASWRAAAEQGRTSK
jgi:S1-C subfamily serine protease